MLGILYPNKVSSVLYPLVHSCGDSCLQQPPHIQCTAGLAEALIHICLCLNPTASPQLSLADGPLLFLCNKERPQEKGLQYTAASSQLCHISQERETVWGKSSKRASFPKKV